MQLSDAQEPQFELRRIYGAMQLCGELKIMRRRSGLQLKEKGHEGTGRDAIQVICGQ